MAGVRKYEVLLDPLKFLELSEEFNEGRDESLLGELFEFTYRSYVVAGDQFYSTKTHNKEVARLEQRKNKLEREVSELKQKLADIHSTQSTRRLCPEPGCGSKVVYRSKTDLYTCGKCGWSGPAVDTVIDED
jgi:predicted RNA-binding Zn-ribbon protein involved in translation (DUF1610 family)